MGSLFAFFGSLAVSLPSRILASLGMGFISYAGYSVVGSAMVDLAVNNYSSIGGNALAFMSIGGFGTGFGLILGAIITRLSLMAFTTLGKLT